jgi:hypothetical protein
MTWLWKAYVAAFLTATAIYYALPGGTAADLVYGAIRYHGAGAAGRCRAIPVRIAATDEMPMAP